MSKGLAAAMMMLCLCACGGDEEEEQDEIKSIRISPLFLEGELTVKGTVELPPSTAKGERISFEFVRLDEVGFTSSETHSNFFTNDSKTVEYEIVGMKDGEYKFRLSVDQDDDDEVSKGDPNGWYGGTLQSPILDEGQATTLKLEGRNHEGIDFGLGITP